MTAQPAAASHQPTWPPVAIPGQVGIHRAAVPTGDRDSPTPLGSATSASDTDGSPTENRSTESADRPATPFVGPLTEGAALLGELRSAIETFVVLPHRQALNAVTLWVAATHLQPAWQHAPRLAVVGPAKRCGKSRLLDVLHETVHDPFITVNSTPAAIFRSITANPPTLLVDEADTIFGSPKVAEKNEEMRGLLNSGHHRNRPTTRVAGNDHQPTKFRTFAMAALAGIGDLPDTIMDRSVVIRMRRRALGESVRPYRSRRDTPALNALRQRLAVWLGPHLEEAADSEPVMPVEDRAADTWEPLIVIADLAGGPWPAWARTACQMMTAYEQGQEEDHGGLKIRILTDIRQVFASYGNPDALPTESLLAALRADTEGPWAEYGNGGLSARGLQLLLGDYQIRSANHRFGDIGQRKGFSRNQFTDAWMRYCPPPARTAP
ncbi:DUF3631 domain-containing protein [Streptomyces sp. NPDC048506]|uniref:DUF3631 domain-containing protein n=1 Tax=Streptomyces sp. NPDC048506 TaxID=3155028 RepID=UPI003439DAFF